MITALHAEMYMQSDVNLITALHVKIYRYAVRCQTTYVSVVADGSRSSVEHRKERDVHNNITDNL